MDIVEKRVLRRKTPIIAQTIVYGGHVATAAIKQGLVSEAESLVIQMEPSNRSRVRTFLQSLESLPGPRVAFEKLCYLLEHQGHSWLCDELWVELICEHGNLTIEPAVYAEAKMLVRQRLEQKKVLDDQDLEELTLLIATRYQVAKETFRRQANRSCRQKALAKMVIENDIRDLCSQIDHCMSVSSKTLNTRGDSGISQMAGDESTVGGAIFSTGVASTAGRAITPSLGTVAPIDNVATPSLDACTPSFGTVTPSVGAATPSSVPTNTNSSGRNPSGRKPQETKELTKWVHSLKSKISNLTNAYVSHVVNDASKKYKKRDRFGNAPVEEESDSGGEKSSDADDTMDPEYYDDIAERQFADLRRQRAGAKSCTPRVGLPLHMTARQDPQVTKYNILDKYKLSNRCQTAESRLEGDRSVKPFRRRIRRKKKTLYDRSDMVKVKFQLTESERQKTDEEIHQDIQDLRNKQATLRSRQALGGTLAPKDMSELEQLFWEKRAQSMTKCRSVGYYYFLSEFKRKRCYSCAVEPEKQIKCAWMEKPKKTGRTIKLPSNLYDNKSWSGVATDGIDDTQCPGAGPHPKTGEKRCLACAYANKDLPSFYDAVVAPDGSRHFEYPQSKGTYKTRGNSAPVPTVVAPQIHTKKTVRIA